MHLQLLQAATSYGINEGLIISISTVVGKLGITGLLAFAIWYLDRRHRSIEEKREGEKKEYYAEMNSMRVFYDKKCDDIIKKYDIEIRELDAKYDLKIENLITELIGLNRKQSEVIEKTNGTLKSLEESVNRLSDKLN